MTKICQRNNNDNSCDIYQIENGVSLPLVYNGLESVRFNDNDKSLFKNMSGAREEMQRPGHDEYVREVRKFYNFISCPLNYEFTHDASAIIDQIDNGYKSLLNNSICQLQDKHNPTVYQDPCNPGGVWQFSAKANKNDGSGDNTLYCKSGAMKKKSLLGKYKSDNTVSGVESNEFETYKRVSGKLTEKECTQNGDGSWIPSFKLSNVSKGYVYKPNDIEYKDVTTFDDSMNPALYITTQENGTNFKNNAQSGLTKNSLSNRGSLEQAELACRKEGPDCVGFFLHKNLQTSYLVHKNTKTRSFANKNKLFSKLNDVNTRDFLFYYEKDHENSYCIPQYMDCAVSGSTGKNTCNAKSKCAWATPIDKYPTSSSPTALDAINRLDNDGCYPLDYSYTSSTVDNNSILFSRTFKENATDEDSNPVWYNSSNKYYKYSPSATFSLSDFKNSCKNTHKGKLVPVVRYGKNSKGQSKEYASDPWGNSCQDLSNYYGYGFSKDKPGDPAPNCNPPPAAAAAWAKCNQRNVASNDQAASLVKDDMRIYKPITNVFKGCINTDIENDPIDYYCVPNGIVQACGTGNNRGEAVECCNGPIIDTAENKRYFNKGLYEKTRGPICLGGGHPLAPMCKSGKHKNSSINDNNYATGNDSSYPEQQLKGTGWTYEAKDGSETTYTPKKCIHAGCAGELVTTNPNACWYNPDVITAGSEPDNAIMSDFRDSQNLPVSRTGHNLRNDSCWAYKSGWKSGEEISPIDNKGFNTNNYIKGTNNVIEGFEQRDYTYLPKGILFAPDKGYIDKKEIVPNSQSMWFLGGGGAGVLENPGFYDVTTYENKDSRVTTASDSNIKGQIPYWSKSWLGGCNIRLSDLGGSGKYNHNSYATNACGGNCGANCVMCNNWPENQVARWSPDDIPKGERKRSYVSWLPCKLNKSINHMGTSLVCRNCGPLHESNITSSPTYRWYPEWTLVGGVNGLWMQDSHGMCGATKHVHTSKEAPNLPEITSYNDKIDPVGIKKGKQTTCSDGETCKCAGNILIKGAVWNPQKGTWKIETSERIRMNGDYLCSVDTFKSLQALSTESPLLKGKGTNISCECDWGAKGTISNPHTFLGWDTTKNQQNKIPYERSILRNNINSSTYKRICRTLPGESVHIPYVYWPYLIPNFLLHDDSVDKNIKYISPSNGDTLPNSYLSGRGIRKENIVDKDGLPSTFDAELSNVISGNWCMQSIDRVYLGAGENINMQDFYDSQMNDWMELPGGGISLFGDIWKSIKNESIKRSDSQLPWQDSRHKTFPAFNIIRFIGLGNNKPTNIALETNVNNKTGYFFKLHAFTPGHKNSVWGTNETDCGNQSQWDNDAIRAGKNSSTPINWDESTKKFTSSHDAEIVPSLLTEQLNDVTNYLYNSQHQYINWLSGGGSNTILGTAFGFQTEDKQHILPGDSSLGGDTTYSHPYRFSNISNSPSYNYNYNAHLIWSRIWPSFTSLTNTTDTHPLYAHANGNKEWTRTNRSNKSIQSPYWYNTYLKYLQTDEGQWYTGGGGYNVYAGVVPIDGGVCSSGRYMCNNYTKEGGDAECIGGTNFNIGSDTNYAGVNDSPFGGTYICWPENDDSYIGSGYTTSQCNNNMRDYTGNSSNNLKTTQKLPISASQYCQEDSDCRQDSGCVWSDSNNSNSLSELKSHFGCGVGGAACDVQYKSMNTADTQSWKFGENTITTAGRWSIPTSYQNKNTNKCNKVINMCSGS